jgi:hypothetical protein
MSGAERAARRSEWPVRIFRLGEEPSENILSSTTAGQRIAMMWPLAEEAWRLAGRPTKRVPRSELPVRCVRRPPDSA